MAPQHHHDAHGGLPRAVVGLWLLFLHVASSACVPGEYQVNVPGYLPYCSPCKKGTYTPQHGASSCTTCEAGSWSDSGAAACQLCSPGTYLVDNSNHCAPCKAGTYSSKHGASSCKKCEAGGWSDSGAAACQQCSPGTYLAATASHCVPCYPDSPTEQLNCFYPSCPAGTYAIASDVPSLTDGCVKCPKASFAPHNGGVGAKGCLPCADEEVGPGATECSKLPVGAPIPPPPPYQPHQPYQPPREPEPEPEPEPERRRGLLQRTDAVADGIGTGGDDANDDDTFLQMSTSLFSVVGGLGALIIFVVGMWTFNRRANATYRAMTTSSEIEFGQIRSIMHNNKTKPRMRHRRGESGETPQGFVGRTYEGISSYFHDDSGILL